MLNGTSVVALVPARRGSKQLPGKNVRYMAGKPMAAWSIIAGQLSRFVDEVVVSTDDPILAEVASGLGVRIIDRPLPLALDTSPMSQVIEHVMTQTSKHGVVVLLQPTSPLRTAEHVDEALSLLAQHPEDAVASVSETEIPPELMYRSDESGRMVPVLVTDLTRRQDFPRTYALNGAIYAAFLTQLHSAGYQFQKMDKRPYIMPKSASVDVDTIEDFVAAEERLARLPQ